MVAVRDIQVQARRFHPVPAAAKIPQQLLPDDARLQVLHRVGRIQGRNAKVRRGEPPLGQKGAENKDGIVAAGEGLLEIDPRAIRGATGRHLFAYRLPRRRVDCQLRIVRQRPGDGSGQRQCLLLRRQGSAGKRKKKC